MQKFKIGDFISCSELPSYAQDTTVGKVYRVGGKDEEGDLWFLDDKGCRNFALVGWEDYGFEVVNTETIAKPILEERKVGKIEMDLFDSGFPNAVLEVAKVMTWAGQNKGYKPHDWKSLPNAEVEFSAAATRHRLKGFIQKAEGVPAIDRVDEESGISHLCHAAFNCLAELELVLTGKIK